MQIIPYEGATTPPCGSQGSPDLTNNAKLRCDSADKRCPRQPRRMYVHKADNNSIGNPTPALSPNEGPSVPCVSHGAAAERSDS
jgi:hypothetical protein